MNEISGAPFGRKEGVSNRILPCQNYLRRALRRETRLSSLGAYGHVLGSVSDGPRTGVENPPDRRRVFAIERQQQEDPLRFVLVTRSSRSARGVRSAVGATAQQFCSS